MLNESSDIMWETSFGMRVGQGVGQIGGKSNSRKRTLLKKSVKSWTEIYSAFR